MEENVIIDDWMDFSNIKKMGQNTYEITGIVWEKTWTEDEEFIDQFIEILDQYKGENIKVNIKIELQS
ncbi:MAG: hypothetical protein ACTSXH_13140 [Promethearchaeota archaeon]